MDANRPNQFCLAPLLSSFDGATYEIIAIQFGERGYHETTYGRQTSEWIRMMNDRIGISEAAQEAYTSCSLFGRWGNFNQVLEHYAAAIAHKGTTRAAAAGMPA